ncbi:MAG: hypothetical protein M1834_009670 [Cirrosporium novae-zelandiae]|nr:MAG: hypothetical protein M1834_009670 [Cirrosporium novae-zelandiae]
MAWPKKVAAGTKRPGTPTAAQSVAKKTKVAAAPSAKLKTPRKSEKSSDYHVNLEGWILTTPETPDAQLIPLDKLLTQHIEQSINEYLDMRVTTRLPLFPDFHDSVFVLISDKGRTRDVLTLADRALQAAPPDPDHIPVHTTPRKSAAMTVEAKRGGDKGGTKDGKKKELTVGERGTMAKNINQDIRAYFDHVKFGTLDGEPACEISLTLMYNDIHNLYVRISLEGDITPTAYFSPKSLIGRLTTKPEASTTEKPTTKAKAKVEKEPNSQIPKLILLNNTIKSSTRGINHVAPYKLKKSDQWALTSSFIPKKNTYEFGLQSKPAAAATSSKLRYSYAAPGHFRVGLIILHQRTEFTIRVNAGSKAGEDGLDWEETLLEEKHMNDKKGAWKAPKAKLGGERLRKFVEDFNVLDNLSKLSLYSDCQSLDVLLEG